MRPNLQTDVFFIQTVLGAELEQCVIWVGRDQWRQEKWRDRQEVQSLSAEVSSSYPTGL